VSRLNNNNSLQPYSQHTLIVKPSQEEVQPGSHSKRRLSVERSLSSEDQHHQNQHAPGKQGEPGARGAEEDHGPTQKQRSLQFTHHRGNNGPTHQHHYSHATTPLQSSGSAHNIRDWGEDCTPDCVACIRPHCQSQRSLDLDTSPHSGGKQHKKLERMYSEDRVSSEDRGKKIT
ncbi:hypothetical protein M9458_011803, partial [Cirrhinus mrigala]